MDILFGRNQFPVVVSFFICGIISGIFNDVLRIKRRIFADNAVFLFFDDLLFFTVSSVLVIFNAYSFNDGNMKWYELPVMIFGFILYRKTVSHFFINVCFKIIDFTERILCFITTPFYRLLLYCKRKLLHTTEALRLYVYLGKKQRAFAGLQM